MADVKLTAEIETKLDPTGIDKAKKAPAEVEGAFNRMAGGDRGLGKLASAVQGNIRGIVEAAMRFVGPIGAAVAGVGALGKALYDAFNAKRSADIDALNGAMERAHDSAKRLFDAMAWTREGKDRELLKSGDIDNLRRRVTEAEKEFDRLKKASSAAMQGTAGVDIKNRGALAGAWKWLSDFVMGTSGQGGSPQDRFKAIQAQQNAINAGSTAAELRTALMDEARKQIKEQREASIKAQQNEADALRAGAEAKEKEYKAARHAMSTPGGIAAADRVRREEEKQKERDKKEDKKLDAALDSAKAKLAERDALRKVMPDIGMTEKEREDWLGRRGAGLSAKERAAIDADNLRKEAAKLKENALKFDPTLIASDTKEIRLCLQRQEKALTALLRQK